MEDKKNMLQEWLLRATKDIRFGPDRKAVSAELQEHIEDKIFDLKRLYPGMSDEAAAQRALDQMGDAAEIGRELAKIHRPWLGYLWRCSQVLLCVASLFAFIGLTRLGTDQVGSTVRYAYQDVCGYIEDQAVFHGAVPEGERRIALYRPDVQARQGDCTISVPNAARYQEAGEAPALFVELNLKFDVPWEMSKLPVYYLWAEDDLGNQYMTQGHKATGTDLSTLTWVYHCVVLEDFPENASWLKFRYIDGTPFELTVDLTKEVSP